MEDISVGQWAKLDDTKANGGFQKISKNLCGGTSGHRLQHISVKFFGGQSVNAGNQNEYRDSTDSQPWVQINYYEMATKIDTFKGW